MNKGVSFLTDAHAFVKFCSKNDKAFGCKKAFGCSLTCPLWLARESQYLVNEKGMTIGEAHRACMRAYIEPRVEREIIKEAIISAKEGKKPYPEEGKLETT